jgi:hypothetical protein
MTDPWTGTKCPMCGKEWVVPSLRGDCLVTCKGEG